MTAFPAARVVAALDRAGLLVSQRGSLPAAFSAISDDSRAVTAGSLFVAVRGSERDGHDYLGSAATAHAAAAIVEDESRTSLPCLVVREGRRAVSVAAAAAYGEPASQLTLVAVTGTNGKTTTVGLLRHLLDDPGARCASVGTLGVLIGSQGTPLPGGGGLTTPGPIELQRLLRSLVDAGVTTAAIEVSSHSLDQRRVEGVRFAAGLFTNLTRDHLDYHGTMDAYFAAKARLIDHLADDGAAVVNADDTAWTALPAAPHLVRFSATGARADVTALNPRFAPRGSQWTLAIRAGALDRRGAAYPVRLPLIGDFNVANAVGAAAVAITLGRAPAEVAARLATAPQVPGRLEVIHTAPTVLRDYAHTPDALDRALTAVRPFVSGRLIVVFGAGGDRDAGKRPAMGAIAERDADIVILTSDNPRTEDPESILDDLERGMSRSDHERIEDRRAAIARALELAGSGDVVVLAGKGHETYQVRGATRYPFDERAIVAELAAEHAS